MWRLYTNIVQVCAKGNPIPIIVRVAAGKYLTNEPQIRHAGASGDGFRRTAKKISLRFARPKKPLICNFIVM
jgi:hypothetical protein